MNETLREPRRAARRTVVGYRLGDRFSLDSFPGAQPVTVLLDEGVHLRCSHLSGCFFHRDEHPYGTGLMAALKLGWCRIAGEG